MIYVVDNIKAGKTKTGNKFYSISGKNEGKCYNVKIFAVKEEVKKLDVIDAIEQKEDVFNGTKQYIVERYERIDISEEDKNKHLGIKTINKDEIFKEIQDIIKTNVADTEILHIYNNIVSKYEEQFKAAFGAASVHHNYSGGLIEHTLEVLKICKFLGDMYLTRTEQRDMLLVAAALHDIGKIWSYSENGEYDFDGQMLEHIFTGASIVMKEGVENNISTRKTKVLCHMILSHHGQRDWGSPVEPKVIEAQLLHFADNISAKAGIFIKAKEEYSGESEFSDRINSLGTSIFMGDSYQLPQAKA